METLNFQAKFMNHFGKNQCNKPETDSLPIIYETHNKDPELDISYSEIVVGSTKTIYSSDEELNADQYEYETESQIQRKVSEILSQLSYSPGSFVNLSDDSFHIWNESVRLDKHIIEWPRVKKEEYSYIFKVSYFSKSSSNFLQKWNHNTLLVFT